MSLTLRGHGRRRATDEVQRLRDTELQLRAALADAGRTVTDLTRRLDLVSQRRADAELLAVAQQAHLDEVGAERDLLRGEVAALRRELYALRAADANDHAVTV
ncbi:MAG TPA: hypothetical protein VGF17_29120, partial [Phytomonospora sp.]